MGRSFAHEVILVLIPRSTIISSHLRVVPDFRIGHRAPEAWCRWFASATVSPGSFGGSTGSAPVEGEYLASARSGLGSGVLTEDSLRLHTSRSDRGTLVAYLLTGAQNI